MVMVAPSVREHGAAFGRLLVRRAARGLRAKTTFAAMHQIPPNLDGSIRSGRSMKSAETGET